MHVVDIQWVRNHLGFFPDLFGEIVFSSHKGYSAPPSICSLCQIFLDRGHTCFCALAAAVLRLRLRLRLLLLLLLLLSLPLALALALALPLLVLLFLIVLVFLLLFGLKFIILKWSCDELNWFGVY